MAKKPSYMLDEQMYMGDAKTTLLHQIRGEGKETNKLLKKLLETQESGKEAEKEESKAEAKDEKKSSKKG